MAAAPNVKFSEILPSQLPIAEAHDELIKELNDNQTLIIIGETGCGKTTQVPKYILGAELHRKKMIAVTQPRRVAAISLARRVAEELGEEVGGTVGYSVRFDDRTSKKTVIKFMTDGMLLREGLQNPLFQKYSYIILDEAHERTINTDLLMGLVKGAQKKRFSKKDAKKHLNIVVMSATMDVDKFHAHFENSKVVYVEGRQHAVSLFQCLETPDDYCLATITLIMRLHGNLAPEENILAFLTGQYEIDSVVSVLKVFEWKVPMEVYPLYAALSHEDQMKVLTPPVQGIRRVVISTNIAETSLTIPGIKVVIDCGYVKTKFHEYVMSFDTLGVTKISKAQAMQRAGRAGRESSGRCYRLYTKDFFAKLDDNTVPEILRVQMSRCILHLLRVGVHNPLTFDWVDPPTHEATLEAMTTLANLGAIADPEEYSLPQDDDGDGKSVLTNMGRRLVSIPLEPGLGLVLLRSMEFDVVEPITCILAVLCSENIFRGYDEKAANARLKFAEPEGDLIMYLKIFREFRKCTSKFEWCKLNALSFRALSLALKVRDHLFRLCGELGLNTQKNLPWEDTKENIRKCFLSCMKNNIAFWKENKGCEYVISNRARLPAKIHPSSSLYNKKCPSVLFTEITQTASGIKYMKHVINLAGLEKYKRK